MPEYKVFKYHAFISYSHLDKAYVSIIQKSLESLGLPFYKKWKHDLKFFRDERKIPLSDCLTNEILEGLEESKYLIVIASENSASSKWVKEEIENWHKLNMNNEGFIMNFNIILIDDSIEWDDKNKDFNKLKTTALPTFENKLFKSLPIWANLQKYCKNGKVNTNNENYEWELAKVKGFLLNKRPDEIIDDISAAKNLFRTFLGIVISVLLFLIAFAFKERDKALKQKNIAIEQKNIAEANYLISEARSAVEKNPTVALWLVGEAISIRNDSAIEKAAEILYRENSFYKTIAIRSEEIHSAAFSPDGRTIIFGYGDSTAILQDLNGRVLLKLVGHTGRITSAIISPDGKALLTASTDNTARLWDLRGNTICEFKGHKNVVTSVAFSPDGKAILTGSWDHTARLWDLKGNTLEKIIGHSDHVTSVAFSPDGKLLLTGSSDFNARLWSKSGQSLKKFENRDGEISSVAFSPDGRSILTGSNARTARLWDLNGDIRQEFKGGGSDVAYVAFSPDGQSILTGSYNKACIWDYRGYVVQEFKGHTGNITSVAYSPDGKTIITSAGVHGGTGLKDCSIRLWQVKNCLRQFEGHSDLVSSLAFSPDNKTILTGSFDSTSLLWDIRGNKIQVFKGHTDKVTSVTFSPDGRRVLTGSLDNSARLYDLNGNTLQIFHGHKKHITSLAFSPDGEKILTGSDDATAILWDLRGNILQVFKGHNESANHRIDLNISTNLIITYTGINSVASSPNGKYILTGADDNRAILWDLKGNIVQDIEIYGEVKSVAFSPDGKSILTGLGHTFSGNAKIIIWDTKGNILKKIESVDRNVLCVAFSPDGKTVITGSDDNIARLFDLRGNLLQQFEGNANYVRSVAFSPNGESVLVGADIRAHLWNAIRPLNDFLRSDKVEPLSTEQKKYYRIRLQ